MGGSRVRQPNLKHRNLDGGRPMIAYLASDLETEFPIHSRWRIEWWGLLRGAVLLSSALLSVTILFHVFQAAFQG
jgi:hypothetical protein